MSQQERKPLVLLARDFERALVDLTDGLRERFESHNANRFEFGATVEGRPTGNLLIKFGFGEYSATTVQANSIMAALEEYERRQGFEKAHMPLCLPYAKPEPQVMEEEPEPFVEPTSDPEPEELLEPDDEHSGGDLSPEDDIPF